MVLMSVFLASKLDASALTETIKLNVTDIKKIELPTSPDTHWIAEKDGREYKVNELPELKLEGKNLTIRSLKPTKISLKLIGKRRAETFEEKDAETAGRWKQRPILIKEYRFIIDR